MENCLKVQDPSCHIKNPLVRNGTSRRDRQPAALSPDYVKLDGRSTEDIITFVYEYAKCVTYYNTDNDPEGNWQSFFDFDIGTFLAIISSRSGEGLERRYRVLVRNLMQDRDAFSEGELTTDPDPGNFRKIIDFLYRDLLLLIKQVCERAPADHPFRKEILGITEKNIVKAILDNNIQSALVKLIGYDKGNVGGDREVNDYSDFINTGSAKDPDCIQVWAVDQLCYDCIYPDKNYTLESFYDLFEVFYKAYILIRDRAQYYFKKFLDEQDTHLPHIALFLTFLHLFKYAQNNLNELTAEHLRHYYEKVLCIKRKSEIADKVHVVFELAKNFPLHKVDEGVELIGGKDAEGKDRVFKLQEELVVNEAEVAQIKTVFVNEDLENSGVFLGVHAVTDARMADGIETPFDIPEERHWSALGDTFHSPDNPSPRARIGFAIASPMLFLREGTRTIDLLMDFGTYDQVNDVFSEKLFSIFEETGGFQADLLSGKFAMEISAEEEWLPITDESSPNLDPEAVATFEILDLEDTGIDLSGNVIGFRISLGPTAPAIVPFPGTEDEIPFDTPWPILKIYLKNYDEEGNEVDPFLYGALRELRMQGLSLMVDVQDVRSLVVENDQSVLNPDKQFYMFGPTPSVGSQFYLGNWEVFSKKLDELKIKLEWADLPQESFFDHYDEYIGLLPTGAIPDTNTNDFTVSIDYLKDRTFENVARQKQLFEDDANEVPQATREIILDGDLWASFGRASNLPVFDRLDRANTSRGFLRLTLDGSDFLHDHYSKVLTYVSVELAAEGGSATGTDLPNEPYTPTLNAISLSYSSSLEVPLNELGKEPEQFFHLTPFGHREIILEAREQESGDPSVMTPILPQFGVPGPFIEKKLECIEVAYNPPGVASDGTNGEEGTDNGDVERLPSIRRSSFPLPRSTAPARGPARPVSAASAAAGSAISLWNRGTIPTNIPVGTTSITNLRLRDRAPLTVERSGSQIAYLREDIIAKELLRANMVSAISYIPFIPFNIVVKLLLEGKSASAAFVNQQEPLVQAVRGLQQRQGGFPLAAGNLYVGFKNLKPRRSISVLFQVLEGSGNNEFAPPDIQWSFLKDNEWVEFAPFQILSDSTKPDPNSRNSLLRSGIIKFTIPKEISNKETTILNPDYHWIRASTILPAVDDGTPISPAALPDLVDIRAQAAEAVFVNQNNSLEHLETALEANSISQLVVRQVEVKQVEQPYSSFDGKLPESDDEFFRRVSERLRHRDRAITPWDYERLVLEEYPQIYKVKCLNHTNSYSEVAPKHVTVAVIPSLENKNTFNPLEPRAPIGTLREIEAYLRSKSNLFLWAWPDNLQVVNPLYEEIRVACCVAFMPGRDEDFYQHKLNQDLKQYLAPWAFREETDGAKGSNSEESVEIIFGSVLHQSEVLNFIEEQDYVDVVAGFALLHFDSRRNLVPYYDENGVELKPEEIEEIIPTTSRSILTSYQKGPDKTEEIPFGYDHLIQVTSKYDDDGLLICPPCPRKKACM